MIHTRLDPVTDQAAHAFVDKLAGRFDVAWAVLFGSRARQEHRPDSDADVADVAYDVLLETGVLIQPLPIWEDEWAHPEDFINPALLRNISRDGVRL